MPKQNTLRTSATIEGIGVNSGEPVKLTLKPAPARSGIIFRRTDLPGNPEIPASVDGVTDLVRKTALATGAAQVYLVEHVLSALHGCEVDNVVVEMSAAEAPIMDGSAKPFADLIRSAGLQAQDADREYFVVESPVVATKGAATIMMLPSSELRITCTAVDDRAPYFTQHLSMVISPDVYVREIAPARTYVLYDDAVAMKKAGGIKGGSPENCIVLRGTEILENQVLRYSDELVRHKILDILGDILLCGLPVRGHIVALRTGHAVNAELSRQVIAHGRRTTG